MKKWYGIEGITFLYHGECVDAEIEYKGYIFNSQDIEYAFYEDWKESNSDIQFEDYMLSEGDHIKEYLDDCILIMESLR